MENIVIFHILLTVFVSVHPQRYSTPTAKRGGRRDGHTYHKVQGKPIRVKRKRSEGYRL